MKQSELKQILKPLVKQCIKECIFEDGVLSGIITEVVKGLEDQRLVTEGVTIKAKPPAKEDKERQRKLEEEYEEQRQKRIKKLNESVSPNGVNVFENVSSIPRDPNPGEPISSAHPEDSGVNIDGILGLANGKWKQLI